MKYLFKKENVAKKQNKKKSMKKKCYNEECDWEVTYVTLRVCLCVYVAECMRVCAFYLVCVLQNPQTFFFFFVSFWFFFSIVSLQDF